MAEDDLNFAPERPPEAIAAAASGFAPAAWIVSIAVHLALVAAFLDRTGPLPSPPPAIEVEVVLDAPLVEAAAATVGADQFLAPAPPDPAALDSVKPVALAAAPVPDLPPVSPPGLAPVAAFAVPQASAPVDAPEARRPAPPPDIPAAVPAMAAQAIVSVPDLPQPRDAPPGFRPTASRSMRRRRARCRRQRSPLSRSPWPRPPAFGSVSPPPKSILQPPAPANLAPPAMPASAAGPDAAVALLPASDAAAAEVAATPIAPTPIASAEAPVQAAPSPVVAGSVASLDRDLAPAPVPLRVEAELATPRPPAPVQVPFGLDRAALARVASGFDCSKISVAVDEDLRSVSLSGHIRSEGDRDRLAQTIAALGDVPNLSLGDLHVVGEPYCRVLAFLERPELSRSDDQVHDAATIGKSAQAGVLRLTEGMALQLRLRSPNFSSFLYVDYFTADGKVFHLFPERQQPEASFTPDEAILIGGPGGRGLKATIGPPFGLDMVVALASEKPLSPRGAADRRDGRRTSERADGGRRCRASQRAPAAARIQLFSGSHRSPIVARSTDAKTAPAGEHDAPRRGGFSHFVDLRQSTKSLAVSAFRPVEPDLEVGGTVAVHVSLDEGVVVRRAGDVELLPGHLVRLHAALGRDEAEGVVGGGRGLGVDAGEVDLVDARLEVDDAVDAVRRVGILRLGEEESVLACTARQDVSALAAPDQVVAGAGIELVVAAMPDEHVVALVAVDLVVLGVAADEDLAETGAVDGVRSPDRWSPPPCRPSRRRRSPPDRRSCRRRVRYR